jgi:hypothetical protein
MTDAERRDNLGGARRPLGPIVDSDQHATADETWHEAINDPTIADAICERVVHNAHVLKLAGPSIRRKKAFQPETQA